VRGLRVEKRPKRLPCGSRKALLRRTPHVTWIPEPLYNVGAQFRHISWAKGATTVFVMEQTLPDDTVLIAGGGPVGLILATVLSYYGVKSVLLERNNTTTK
jgi:hypothetical protein